MYFVEQRVVGPEKLRDRVARRGARRDGQSQPRHGRTRLQARVDADARAAVLAVHAPVVVDRLEVVNERARALARPEEDDAAAVEREVKEAEHLLLRGGLQVDEQVAAAHEIDAREGRVA